MSQEARKNLHEIILFSLFGSHRSLLEERLRVNLLCQILLDDEKDRYGTKLFSSYAKYIGGRKFLQAAISKYLKK